METFILDSFGATIKLTIFLCMIVIFIVKVCSFRVIGHFVLILIPMKLDIVWLHRYFILFLRR